MIPITIFLFVPGKDWQMTTAEAEAEADMKEQAERFATMFGESKWTDLRVFAKPLYQAKRGEVCWK